MKLKSLLYSAAFAVASLPALALAEDPVNNGESITVTPIIDPTSVQTSLTTMMTNWLKVGLGVGIAIFAVYMGWRILKRFTR